MVQIANTYMNATKWGPARRMNIVGMFFDSAMNAIFIPNSSKILIEASPEFAADRYDF